VNSNRLSVILITIGTLLIVAAIGLLAVVATGIVGSDDRSSDLETVVGFGDISTPTPGPTPTPSAEFPAGSSAPIARIIVPVAEIDAPIVVKGVDNAGVMIAPSTAHDVAWYDFSAHPGFGGNAVFAAHVDYVNVGPAVFWNLKDLEPGDIIDIRLEDGTLYRYAVNFKQQYDSATAPVAEIVGATPKESVTLITCSGTFSSATHQYDKRLVVRAERIQLDAAPGPATDLPPGT
jgi:LPXTG-site transpeptidase (sortase) family protein